MNEIVLHLDSGSLEIIPIKTLRDIFIGNVKVTSNWYSATVPFECSIDRIKEFLIGLDSLINRDCKELFFINEDGNVELNLTKDITTGHIVINGLVMLNLNQNSKLVFDLKTDDPSLERFYADLYRFMNS